MLSKQFFEEMGYSHVRQMKNGQWIGLFKMMYSTGLTVDLHENGYEYRYCYEYAKDAVAACEVYEGEENPIGPWLKRKGKGEDRLGPGAKGE